jgi:hypothetical protein
MKTYGGVEVLDSALDGGEWSASRPDRFTSRERDPYTNWTRAGLDAVQERKIFCLCQESNQSGPARSQSL